MNASCVKVTLNTHAVIMITRFKEKNTTNNTQSTS